MKERVREGKYRQSDPANGYVNWWSVKRGFLALKFRQKSLEKPPPKIERVSCDEVYLVDEGGNRLRRICGHQRNKMPIGYVCLCRAGTGTERDWGTCNKHTRGSGGRGIYKRLIDRTAKVLEPRPLATVGQGAPTIAVEIQKILEGLEITEEEMKSVETEMLIIYSLIGYVSQQRELAIRPMDYTAAMSKLADLAMKGKKTRFDMDVSQNYIPKKDFTKFIDRLVDLVLEECGTKKGSALIVKIKRLMTGQADAGEVAEENWLSSRRAVDVPLIEAGGE